MAERRWWHYRHHWYESQDGYLRVRDCDAAFIRRDGTEVWPVRSKDPEADHRAWLREVSDELQRRTE